MQQSQPKLVGISEQNLQEKISAFLVDPVFNESTFLYFTDNRDPTAVEPYVSSINIPSGWLYYWWNTSTQDIFDFIGTDGSGNLLWQKHITFPNMLSNIQSAGWHINTPRSYAQRTSPAFSTPYTPSSTNDTEVILIVSLTSTLLTAAEVDVQINTGSGYVQLVQESLSGLAATSIRTVTFIVPANASYQLISVSGSVSINKIMELTQ